MKAFIVLALVAVCAARSVDVSDLLREKSLLTKDDLFNKIGSTHRFSNLFDTTKDWTTSKKVGSYYPYQTEDVTTEPSYYNRRVTLYSFEELVSTPLFREYYNIPLFRQFLEQYPVVFRRYVESPLFQQFWTVPQFMQYFRNPVFFYKYIVPQIQIVSQQTETSYPYNYEQGYNYQGQDVSRDVTVGDYLSQIFGQQYNKESTPFYPYSSTTYRYGSEYPVFGQHTFGRQGVNNVFGREGINNVFGRNVNNVNYKFLLDKIYRTLFVDQPTVGDVTDVRTDVKVAPAHKKVIVEPTTGETKVVYVEPKIVDVKVSEKTVPRTTEVETEENEIVKETILKRLLVQKRISIQLYTILKTLPLTHVQEIVRKIVSHPQRIGGVETVYGDDTDFTFPTGYDNIDVNDVYRHKFNDVTSRDVLSRDVLSRDVLPRDVLPRDVLPRDIFTEKYLQTPVIRELLKTLGHHEVRDVVPTVEDIFRH